MKLQSEKVYTGYWEKVLHREGSQALEQAPQGLLRASSGHGIEPAGVQEVFG